MGWEDVVPEITKLDRFIDLAVSGFKHGLEATQSVELKRRVADVLRQPDPFGTEETFQAALARAQDLETFAKEQAAAKFSYIHELGVVKLWSIVEDAFDQLAFERLRDPAGREHELLGTFEGPLLAFVSATPDEQAEFLLTKLKLAVKASLQRGAGRFEALLNPLGLGGPVDPLVAKALVDLSETRHVIVHRGGVADKQFTSRCPWSSTAVGQRLLVTRRQLTWHTTAVDWYIVEVDARLHSRREGTRSEKHETLKTELLETVRKLTPSAG